MKQLECVSPPRRAQEFSAVPWETFRGKNGEPLPPLPDEWKAVWEQERAEWNQVQENFHEERRLWIEHERDKTANFQAICQGYQEVLEQERTILQNKTFFFSNMVHEVRTQIIGIEGLVDLVHETVDNEDTQEQLNCMRVCTNSLLSLINRFLDFTKIEAGKFEILSREFDLVEELESITELMSVVAEKKMLRITLDIAVDVPLIISSDKLSIRQALTNLLNNAIKFTTEGEVAVCVSVHSKTKDERVNLQFDVQDTGIGISPKNLEHLFQPFAQADNTIRSSFGGTGLGLAITKAQVEALGGRIWVSSQLGEGSTFSFTLPVIPVQSQPVEGISSHPSMTPVMILETGFTQIAIQNFVSRYRMESEVFASAEELCQRLLAVQKQSPEKHYTILINSSFWNDWETCLDHMDEPSRDAILKSSSIVLLRRKQQAIDQYTIEPHCTVFLPFKSGNLHTALHIHNGHLDSPESFSAQEESSSSDANDFSLSNVLIADDNRANRLILTRQFKKVGCLFKIVADGQEALDAMRKEHFDAFFIDCHMPRVSGYDFVDIVRQEEEAGAQYHPICALTADPSAATKVYAAGFDEYLVKPVTIERISEVLVQLLRTSGPGLRRDSGLLKLNKSGKSSRPPSTEELLRDAIENKEANIILVQLLEENASLCEALTESGETLLHLACRHSNVNAIPILLQNMPRDMWAIQSNVQQNNCVHILLQYSQDEESTLSILHSMWKVGALPEIVAGVNARGETPLLVSLHHHRSEKIVKFLVLHGSDPNTIDEQGSTPLCLSYRNANVVACLIDFGADPLLGAPDNAVTLAERDNEQGSLLLMKRASESPSLSGRSSPLNSEIRFSYDSLPSNQKTP